MVEVERVVEDDRDVLVLEGSEGEEVQLRLAREITGDQLGLLADSLRSIVHEVRVADSDEDEASTFESLIPD